MQTVPKLPFEKCAVTSGLLDQSHLDDALAALRAKGVEVNGEPQSEPLVAEELIAAGKLTRFQAVHLLAGHTKLTLGPYRILDSLGQGGMGQVFKAEHSLMAREVAVKVLPKTKSTPESIANFTREIRAMAALDHQNLVRALDAGHDGNVYFLVCEYVPGADLRRYVHNRGPLGMSEAATIISQAAAGLAHAHSSGLDPSRRQTRQFARHARRQDEGVRPRPGRLDV